MAGGLRGRGAVVEDPDFVEPGGAHGDLIEFGVVGDRVHVQEVGPEVALFRAGGDVTERLETRQFRGVNLGRFAVTIDVDQLRMFGGHSKTCLLRIVSLDEMIPHVPLPHNASIIGAPRLDLEDHVRPEPGLRR